MKVLLINGSPHEKGCTYTALREVEATLNREEIETSHFWIGNKPVSGCLACQSCGKLGRCAIDDKVNKLLDLAGCADGFVFGAPVHWAGVNGSFTSLLDRLFYADLKSGHSVFYLKPAAGIVSARRAGTTAALDQLMKYASHLSMPIITSSYWNMVHGNRPEEVLQDLEGMQTMRDLARNMAFFLKCREAGAEKGIPLPELEPHVATNFIR